MSLFSVFLIGISLSMDAFAVSIAKGMCVKGNRLRCALTLAFWFGAFQALMTCVAGVSLVVGGIGIMNMMLTNVTERIREIGLRKALGARRSDITWQFLLESITLCLVGGAFGIILGYAGANVLAQFASLSSEIGGMSVTPVISPTAVGLASGICVGIGVLFGFYPAWRAARLDPVESLRYQ